MKNIPNSLPNFLIGGVVSGGTSFLYSILKQHPEIYLPDEMRPEPSFFYKSWEYNKGLEYYSQRWFSNVPESAVAVGEKSANYLFGGARVARRIHSALPDVKLIFILRNPIERAWGNYRFTALEGLENLNFEEALKVEDQRAAEEPGIWAEIQPHRYISRGFYAQQLKEFLTYFPRSQMLILKSELLSTDTENELRRVYKFLELDDLDFKAQKTAGYSSMSVIDPKIQMDLRNYFGDRFDIFVEATRLELDLSQLIQKPEDIDGIRRLQENMKGKKEKIPDHIRAYLSEIFAEDIKELQGIVDFDTSDWK